MSLPRHVAPGATYLVTRRCTQRQFLLRPCPLNNQIVAYCLAFAAQRTGIQLHGLCVMSNHYHAVLTDPHARLPHFMNLAHLYISKCINASVGRWENMWASEAASAVRLIDDNDVLDKLVYTLCNPVHAGLVATCAQWPGLRSTPDAWLQVGDTIARPPVFFSPESHMPETVTLSFVRPPMFMQLSAEDVAAALTQHVSAKEAELQAQYKKQCRPFAGRKRVLAYQSSDTPQTVAPRRQLSPRIAAKNPWHRQQALKLITHFLKAYRDAYQEWRTGYTSVLFPAGTYGLRVYANVRCCPHC